MRSLLTEMTIREVSTQCTFAIKAYDNINAKAGNTDVVFSSIHSFLSHCRNIWRLLENTKLSQDVQPKTIRELLSVSKSSPLGNTGLRNMLEHYDKELYKWIKGMAGTSLIRDFNVFPNDTITAPDGSVWLRHYDPDKDEFSMLGTALRLGPMAEESKRIRQQADTWVKSLEGK